MSKVPFNSKWDKYLKPDLLNQLPVTKKARISIQYEGDEEFENMDSSGLIIGGAAPMAITVEEQATAKGNISTPTTTSDKWGRPPLKKWDPIKAPLIFQQLNLDHYVAPQRTSGMLGSRIGPVPIIRMYGVTTDGHSVCCHVHGYLPYLYVTAPEMFNVIHVQEFIQALNSKLLQDMKTNRDTISTVPVVLVNIVHKFNLYGYRGQERVPFLKISVALPRFIAPVKRLLEQGLISTPRLGVCAGSAFEADIDFETRFMVDNDIVGCNWIELPAGKYFLRNKDLTQVITPGDMNTIKTRCQFEADVRVDALIAHSTDGEWEKFAPFRILSFDIECAGRKGIFPQPCFDPVIKIASIVQRHGESEPFINVIFSLKTCDPIVETEVLCYESELDLLEAWADFVRRVDPDLITGYNINNFDLWYLLKRAETLSGKHVNLIGRVLDIKSFVKDVQFQSKQMGRRVNKTINMEGRIIFDLFPIVLKDYNLRSYTLNSVSFHFLGQQKENVHHSIITDLQNESDQTRRRLAIYCLKDARLPLLLMDKLMCVVNYMEMARVTGVQLQDLLTRRQQIKVLSQLLRKAKQHDYIIPATQEYKSMDMHFEGATVIEPLRGFYNVPIATLDFASLYPSIMQVHNLCYSTLLMPIRKQMMHTGDYITTPSNNDFVKKSVRKGILPMILEDLLEARRKAKNELKNEKDLFRRKVLDGKQLALKICANSVYGFTGAQNGYLPCVQISQSVTAYGRMMIEMSKNEIEKNFCMANGYKHDGTVIYGDTDSVMVRFGVDNVAEAMALGKDAASFLSKQFGTPFTMEFEKVYFPYLLVNKKRYAGLSFTNSDFYDKMDCKGLETVRRDNCSLVATVMKTCLEKILINRDPDGAVFYAKKAISELLQNKIDISQLVITKELTKTCKEYAAKQAHVVVAEKMEKRDPGTSPKLGDRVPYVIISASKAAPIYLKAEDPIYVLENNVPIDFQYYLENQLSKPLARIFELILGDKAELELLHGDHTQHKVLATSQVGPLSKVIQNKLTCVGCMSVMKHDENGALCVKCQENETEIFMTELNKLSELQIKLNRLWTQCQTCTNSLHQEVLCTNRDCPIFYMRTKVGRDLTDQDASVRRFD